MRHLLKVDPLMHPLLEKIIYIMQNLDLLEYKSKSVLDCLTRTTDELLIKEEKEEL